MQVNFETFFSKIGKSLIKSDLDKIWDRCEKRQKDHFNIADFKILFFDKYFTGGGMSICYSHN